MWRTLATIRFLSLLKLAVAGNIIDYGAHSVNRDLKKHSKEILKAYHAADQIISKGQGNFKGLINENHPNTFFLLMAKCKPMAKLRGYSKNNTMVTQLTTKQDAV